MRLIVLIAAFALVACSTTELPNGCVVDALSHRYAVSSQMQLEGTTAFNEVLLVIFTDQKSGHALSIFEHEGELWAYDYERGSWRISNGTERRASEVAALIYPGWRIKEARWL